MSRHAFFALVALMGCRALADTCPELPVLFIVQDKSGSMNKLPDPQGTPGDPTKWEASSLVVPQLAAQFANRFRFGLAMFPKDTVQFSCTTGTVVAQVPLAQGQSGVAGVASAYLSNVAGGGTPTAATLRAVKTYLDGVVVNAPKYVLLITDGLPNCNLGLNEATCATTTPGCENTSACSGASCCGLGAKDCLDDTATVAAAAALKAKGIKVYVVGFGVDVNKANNKAVLDDIAQAGGTGSAFLASNKVGLTTALGQIAFDAATCCKDECTAGAVSCASAQEQLLCVSDGQLGCTVWKHAACPAQTTCREGQCAASCAVSCTLGDTRCQNGKKEMCQNDGSGCTAWAAVACSGELCDRCSGSGPVPCTSVCTAGEQKCHGARPVACTATAAGCGLWSYLPACSAGTLCASGDCYPTCDVKAPRCASGQHCEAVEGGGVCLPGAPASTAGRALAAAAGCGCQGTSTDSAAVFLALGVWAALRGVRRGLKAQKPRSKQAA